MLLLDEIEKAHPDLFNILLQVMDHGKLTDHNGKQIDFRNVILIMTTNAGAADLAKSAIGFGHSVRDQDDQEAINRLFTPEFRNRLDAVVSFAGLPPAVVHQVVQKFVLQLEAQLADRGVTFDLSEDAVKWLAEKGYDSRMGARPLARVIQEHIKQPLAEEVLFGKLKKGGTVKVRVKTNEDGTSGLDLEAIEDGPVTPKPEPTPKAKRARAKRSKPAAAKKAPPNEPPSSGGGGSSSGAWPGAQGAAEDQLNLRADCREFREPAPGREAGAGSRLIRRALPCRRPLPGGPSGIRARPCR